MAGRTTQQGWFTQTLPGESSGKVKPAAMCKLRSLKGMWTTVRAAMWVQLSFLLDFLMLKSSLWRQCSKTTVVSYSSCGPGGADQPSKWAHSREQPQQSCLQAWLEACSPLGPSQPASGPSSWLEILFPSWDPTHISKFTLLGLRHGIGKMICIMHKMRVKYWFDFCEMWDCNDWR